MLKRQVPTSIPASQTAAPITEPTFGCATRFRECLAGKATVDESLACFPYELPRPEPPISVFYDGDEI